jgi:hypothetical protein
MQACHGTAAGPNEQSRRKTMNQTRDTGAEESCTEGPGLSLVFPIALADRMRVLKKQAIEHYIALRPPGLENCNRIGVEGILKVDYTKGARWNNFPW